MTYTPPLQDMLFVVNDVLGFSNENLDLDTQTQVLEEAAKLASEVLAPLNWTGDQHGTRLKDGAVTTAPGFKEAYRQYREGGWNAVPFQEDYGGQGLPYAIAFPVQEMWQAANMSFGLCPLLNQGAVEAILQHGSQEQKDFYLPKLISGEWTGTMNLTEPQAGSDLGLLKARAEPDGKGAYKIFGQKIFITYGEHDFTDNIIHLVLARLPDAPDDVKGISLFIVPKFLESGARNDVKCTGLEHKLGIHASPTCTMQFGDAGGATGYLIGQPHQGLKYMFTMMNNARLSVGLQGVAIAERATQKAKQFASERLQGKAFTGGQRVTIDQHPDVKRMLLSMQALTQAGRLLTYQAALALDAEDTAAVDILTPLVKSWCTDMACDVASLGIQVHGGMGFVEETGAAQYLRDARILPIYEGTNGIQAADLVFRKIARDEGAAVSAFIAAMQKHAPAAHAEMFKPYFEGLLTAIQNIVATIKGGRMEEAAFNAQPLLKGFALVAAGVLMARAHERAAGHVDSVFKESKQETTAFYLAQILPFARSHLGLVV